MTPTAVAPQLPASPGDFGISRSDYWRHALKKRKGEAAYAIAKLVPLEQGIAAPAGELRFYLWKIRRRYVLTMIISLDNEQ